MTQQPNTNETQNGNITVPQANTDPDSFLVSMLQILAENIGSYVICEFLVGTDTIVGRQGILEFVGPSYIVLHDDTCGTHIICDAFALRFVSICFGDEEENGSSTPNGAQTQTTPQTSQVPTPNNLTGTQMVSANTRAQSQAAFNYAKRRTRR